MKKLFNLWFLFCALFLQGQSNDLTILESDYSNFRYSLYPDNYYVLNSLTSITQVTNTSPEELVKSILAENTLAWKNLNSIDKSSQLSEKEIIRYQKKNNSNKSKNFAQLIQRISFTFKGEDYCFIKFCLHNDVSTNLPVGIYIMKKENGKWFRFRGYNDAVSTMYYFLSFSYFKLDMLFNRNTNNINLENAINKIYVNQKFSIIRFKEYWKSIRTNKNGQEYLYFKEDLNWNDTK